MAMDSLDAVARYAKRYVRTGSAVLRRPGTFPGELQARPGDYIDPIPFALMTFLAGHWLFVQGIEICAQAWGWEAPMFATWTLVLRTEANLTAARALQTIFVFGVIALLLRAGSWATRGLLTIETAGQVVCYAQATVWIRMFVLAVLVMAALTGVGPRLDWLPVALSYAGLWLVLFFRYWLLPASVMAGVPLWRYSGAVAGFVAGLLVLLVAVRSVVVIVGPS